jgi:hypothetical protein
MCARACRIAQHHPPCPQVHAVSQLTLITRSFTVPLHSHRALLATPQSATLVDPTLRGGEAPVSRRFIAGLPEDELRRFCDERGAGIYIPVGHAPAYTAEVGAHVGRVADARERRLKAIFLRLSRVPNLPVDTPPTAHTRVPIPTVRAAIRVHFVDGFSLLTGSWAGIPAWSEVS